MRKYKEGTALERQKAKNNTLSDVECACGCGGFITVRSAKNKAKGKLNAGYIKGHIWKGRNLPESAKQKMRENHADFSGDKNPNFGKGLFREKNPNWQGGKTDKYWPGGQPKAGNHKDREFRKAIKKRDGECILCKNETRLECHHIESWVDREDLRFDETNCVTLCKPCHARADNAHHKETIKPMLRAYIKAIYKGDLNEL